jgi:2-oxoisovalerate dehydrogenase E2 component (dihydrolipoyl transacylase)
MAQFTFKLPDIGEGIAAAEIVHWHLAVGDIIGEDQPLVDMMTDKATVEIESPVAGKVVQIAGKPGEAVPIGAMLAVIEVEGETEAPSTPAPVKVESRPAPVLPVVKEAPAQDHAPAPPPRPPSGLAPRIWASIWHR